MQRAIGVTSTTILFLAAGVYLWIGGAVLLISPKSAPLFIGPTIRRALMLTGPYFGLCMGTAYAVIGWGLFRLKNWARWLAILVLLIGCAVILPLLFVAVTEGHHLASALLGLHLVVRLAGFLYLIGSATTDLFEEHGRGTS